MGCAASSVDWRTHYPAWVHQSAGCMFLGPEHVVVGLQRTRSSEVRISGLGGKREAEESWYETAIRETVEELFHVSEIPAALLDALAKLQPLDVLFQTRAGYVCIVYNIQDLPVFLRICRRFLQSSPLYPTFPTSIASLLLDRRIAVDAEVLQLLLWPYRVGQRQFRISRDLVKDLKQVRNIFGNPAG